MQQLRQRARDEQHGRALGRPLRDSRMHLGLRAHISAAAGLVGKKAERPPVIDPEEQEWAEGRRDAGA